jgi:hypothetical protein
VVVVPFTRDASSSVEYHSHPLADETSRVKEPQPQASIGRKKRGRSENLDEERSFSEESNEHAKIRFHIGHI